MSITEATRKESNELLDKETAYKHIINVLVKGVPLTAREIAKELYDQKLIPYPVRQAVAPRLTELEGVGIVEVTGKAYDVETKRKVALYKLVGV